MMLSGNQGSGKTVMLDYIKLIASFETRGESVGTLTNGLIRIIGPRGSVQARNLLSVISYLEERASVRLHVAG